MKKTILGLSIAGFLFASYMSGIKFFTQTCAFSEPCPLFLGYPACYFGLAMFALLVLLSAMLFFSKLEEKKALLSILTISLAGILFAGYFSIKELPLLFSEGFGAYALGLPTCTLGLIFYILIFILSVNQSFRKK
jgi:disulfide bond formation protein DsbB